ncbi:HAMP domain-containing protein [Anoxybacterium hadale]|uniref:HAMP domain-containing protein n=1 Tax=Anoxybacterium hadale TaxID=3408580 RepID=A0ACD1AAW6_9FIRM|nr:HAMP domain-containing protein [Clostridiales bacterium]
MKLNLSKKIALFVCILILIVASILGVLSVRSSTNALIQQQKELGMQNAKDGAARLNAVVQMRLGILNEVANRADTQSMNWELQREILAADAERLEYLDLAVVSPDGTARYALSGEVAQLGDREYVKKAFQGEANISGVIVSKVTGEPVIMYAAPIQSGNSVIGVLVGRRDGNALSAITDELGSGERGYAFVLGPEGVIYAHPDKNMVLDQVNIFADIETGGSLQEFGLKLEALGLAKEGSIEYNYNGEYRMASLAPIPGTGWTLGVCSFEEDVLKGSVALRNTILIASIVIAAMGILAAVYLGMMISRPIVNLKKIADKLAIGDVNVIAETKQKDEIGDLTVAFAKMIENTKTQTDAAKRIAMGDLTIEVKPRSDADVLGISMAAVVATLKDLVAEAELLTAAAASGRLEVRGDADRFEGGYKEIIAGVNGTLDAVILPLNVAAEYMEQISKGEIPNRITDEYNGDFNEIKNSLNECIDSMNGLLEETNLLIRAAQDGKLDVRGNSEKFSGDWGTLIQGVNNLINAMATPINVTAEYVKAISKGHIPEKITDTYNGDFNEIKENLNSCIDVMNTLLEETNILILAAQEGTLDKRGDADKFSGDWGTLVQGINNLIEAFVRPINLTADYIDRISKGDIPAKITDVYHGDFNEIKNNLNNCIDMISGLLNETNMLIQAAQEGQLDKRADTSGFSGGWGELVGGVNLLLESVVKPIKEVTNVMREISEGNLNVSVEGDYLGEFGVLSSAVNHTASDLNDVVGEISEILGAISDGNLGISNVKEFKGDFIHISNSLNRILESLNTLLGDINTSSDQVSVGSKQVSDGSQTLSQGTAEQASTVEELNASVTEVAALTKENASNANEANQLTQTVKISAEQGNQHMAEMLLAMDEISESSNNISKIIKVIDDIAFQTNILALNAAVEAARAGQHGKGFAVVAEEVRSLAARSAEAAKETTDLIQKSIQKSSAGTEIANSTAKALKEIVSGVGKTADVITTIAKSSNEQAMGIAQINTGLNQVSHVVQNNAATAEQSAASSEELSGQAEMLKEMVGRFRLRDYASEIKLLDFDKF